MGLVAGQAAGQQEPPAEAPVTPPVQPGDQPPPVDLPDGEPVPADPGAAANPAGAAKEQPAAANLPPIEQQAKELTEHAARSIARLAIMDLRAAESPSLPDYRLASILLGLALELTPDDQDLMRWRMEAAWNAGDTDATVDLSRRLIELDPKDTVAQLRLISSRISQLQDTDARIAAYDRMLGPDGAKLDESVRSRLALDAAVLLREHGDEAAFVRRLSEATRLDSTNKEAAALAATFFADHRPNDRVGRLELLSNLLLADPADANVHLSISRELAAAGAFQQAQRFHTNALIILNTAQATNETAQIESLVLTWETEGPDEVIARLNRSLVEQRDIASKQIQERERRGLPTQDLRQPNEIQLNPPFSKAMILAADAMGDKDAVNAYINEYGISMRELVRKLADPAERPPNLSEEEAIKNLAVITADLQQMRLWTNMQVDLAKKQLSPEDPVGQTALAAAPQLGAWLKLRDGDAAGALEDFEAYPIENMPALAGRAMALEALDRREEAAAAYTQLGDMAPLTPIGAWSRSKLERLDLRTIRRPDPALIRSADNIPAWVDRAVREPRSVLNMRIEFLGEKREVAGTSKSKARITLQNISPKPLALGPDRPLNSRLMLGPRIENLPVGGAGVVRPEVLDLDRRLRLNPQERLDIDFWLDPGFTGWLVEVMASQTIRIRWRAVQGFWLDYQGQYQPGPMCIATDTPTLARKPVAEARFRPEEMARKIANDPPFLQYHLAAALRTAMLVQFNPGLAVPPSEPGGPAGRLDYSVALKILSQRFLTFPVPVRMMYAATLPAQSLAPETAVFDEALAAETDPRVRTVILTARVASVDDPRLVQALADPDPYIQNVAKMVAERLKRPDAFCSRLTFERITNPQVAPPSVSEEPK